MLQYWIKLSGNFVEPECCRCLFSAPFSQVLHFISILLRIYSAFFSDSPPLSRSPPGSWAQCMLSDMASEPHRLGLWVPHNSHVSRNPGSREKRVGEDWRGEGFPFSKSTHPWKNDQSHEFANWESLADERRQRQIMREMRVGCGGGGREWLQGRQRGNIESYWREEGEKKEGKLSKCKRTD